MSEEQEDVQASVARSTLLMTAATLGSRVTGLVRTWAMAFALGNMMISSAYQVANNMPNVIYDLVAGGILGTAFLPVYLLQKEQLGREGGDRFASNILNISLIVLGVLSILATVFAPQVISTQTFTVGSDDGVFQVATIFFRIFAIQIVFYGLGGVITGVLNANRIYGIPAVAPVFNNIIVIISLFAYVPLSAVNPMTAIIVLAVGTTLGVVVQFGIQIPTLIKSGFTYTPRIDLHDPALKEALKIAWPTLIYIVGTLISFSCRNAFSLAVGEEGPSSLLYAWMWYQLPYGVIAVSLSTAYLTEMSSAVAREDFSQLKDYLRQGLRITLFAIIPLAALMLVLSTPIIQLFKAGAFDTDAVNMVSWVLRTWVLSLPFYAGAMYFYRVFAALRQFMTFALVSCGLCVIQIGLYAILSRPEVLGLIGITYADFIYYGLMFVIMALILRKRLGSFGMAGIVKMCLKLTVGCVVVVLIISQLLWAFPFGYGMLAGFIAICLYGIVGLIVIFGFAKLLRVPEADTILGLLGKVKGKLLRRA